MLSVQNVSKFYGSQQVLHQINLQFGNGEIHGIVGENGAGKTTLFKCIAGLEFGEGHIQYDGGILKDRLGYLPTSPHFFSYMTAYEYLLLLCNARNIAVPDMNDFNLFDLPLKQYAETYSTGMQKKLAITGMLLQKNDVFILDEPYNGVDISSNMMITDILLKLKSMGKTIILSSHIFSTLQDSCDFLHYLKNGRIETSLPRGKFDKIEDEMKKEHAVNGMIDRMYSN